MKPREFGKSISLKKRGTYDMSQIRHFHFQKRGKSQRGHCDMSLSSGQCDRFAGFKQSDICNTMRGNTVVVIGEKWHIELEYGKMPNA